MCARQSAPNATDVLVTVVEKPVLSLHTGTYVQARSRRVSR